ncbi:unnamed protein product [Schistosoma margrebowiei]|uniref:Uncharacterized protein n=1 Tax=Schistosoma margrebowiei TaxID=48269 RepID=A0A183L9L4_9TREM|nr:unnamed protein product [Schistosoma margrebowiei]
MVVGSSHQETLDPAFVILGTRQQGVPVILRELVLLDGFELIRMGFELPDEYTHQVLLESLTEFFETYSDRPRFSLTFLSELIHENPAYVKLIDEDLSKLIQRIYYEDLMFNSGNMKASSSSRYPFANTLVVLFSDHGPRMGDARLSVQIEFVHVDKVTWRANQKRSRDFKVTALTSVLNANVRSVHKGFYTKLDN